MRDQLFEVANRANYPGTDQRPEADRGVSSPQSIRAAAADMKALQRDWPRLSPEERQNRYSDLINNRLAAAGVPNVSLKDPTDFAQGGFSSQDWTVRATLPKTATLSNADAANLLDTAVHEGVHAQQDFLMLRAVRAAGKEPTGFAPNAVAAADQKNRDAPLTAGQKEYAAALIKGTPKDDPEKYDNAVIGSFGNYEARQGEVQRTVSDLRQNPTRENLERAEKLVQDLGTAQASARTSYEAYRRYGYEADAHAAGFAARTALGAQ